jgi:hypothetical protein
MLCCDVVHGSYILMYIRVYEETGIYVWWLCVPCVCVCLCVCAMYVCHACTCVCMCAMYVCYICVMATCAMCVCACMYVCMCAMCVCVSVCMYVCMFVCIYVCHACACVCMYVGMYVCACMDMCDGHCSGHPWPRWLGAAGAHVTDSSRVRGSLSGVRGKIATLRRYLVACGRRLGPYPWQVLVLLTLLTTLLPKVS